MAATACSRQSVLSKERRPTMWKEMRTIGTELGIVFLLTPVACTVAPAQDVTSSSMPGTDFSKYQTYRWVKVQGATEPNQIVDTQIKTAVDSQLAAKRLTKTDSDKADVYSGYQASRDQEKQWNAYARGGGTLLGWRDGNGYDFPHWCRDSCP